MVCGNVLVIRKTNKTTTTTKIKSKKVFYLNQSRIFILMASFREPGYKIALLELMVAYFMHFVI